MDTDNELCSIGNSSGHKSSLANAELRSSNLPHESRACFSTSVSRSCTTPSNREACHDFHFHHYNGDSDDHRDHTAQDLHQHPESLATPGTCARSTSFSGSMSLPDAQASELDPTGTPLIRAMPSHRNPYQYLQPHTDLVPSDLRHASSGNQFQDTGREPPFPPPFLHPLSFRTKSSTTRSPLPASTQRSRDSRNS